MIIANVLLSLVLTLPHFALHGGLTQSDSQRSSGAQRFSAGEVNRSIAVPPCKIGGIDQSL
ncbi:MAG: hypothetical protein KAS73_09545 [Candidatus Sabulitectum sp.]|nr:hypothetical protein [Candidatus Sabulitectum sp.]